jgi:hypothetical protein
MGAILHHTLSLDCFVAGHDSMDWVFARFGNDEDRQIELERISLGEADQVTDLRHRVVRQVREP